MATAETVEVYPEYGTKHPALWQALADPFEPSEVKTKPQGGKDGRPARQLRYVTARTVMNRLDRVLGPENWWDEYVQLSEHSVLCRLSISMPDGQVITKCDAGGVAGMADPGDDDKSMFSDALKRAAVRWGIGRYLYNDGSVDFTGDHEPAAVPHGTQPAPAHHANGHAPAAPAATPNVAMPNMPRSGKGLFACLKELETKHSISLIKPLNEWAKTQGLPGKMIDFDEGAIALAWTWLCGTLDSIVGQTSPAPASRPQSPAASNGTDVAVLRTRFVALARDIDRAVHGDLAHDDPETLKAEVQTIANMARPGWVVMTLKDVTDPAALKALIAAAESRKAEVESASDVPF